MERVDIYERVTSEIVKAIEAGAGTYRMPWHSTGRYAFSPINAVSRKAYRGCNVPYLWAVAENRGFSCGEWATYKQWASVGAQVRKGEKATQVVFWKFSEVEKEKSDGTKGKKTIPFAAYYSVFNADQVDGYAVDTTTSESLNERIDHAESFFRSIGATVRHGGNRAYYSPSSDHIQMPDFSAFKDSESYYSVLAHEHIHWTGNRLERDLSGRFGDSSYALEELIAELGSAFICAHLKIENEPRPDHAQYIANWLTVLKNDKRAIFTASSQAQKASDYMIGIEETDEERLAA